ncbi:hypothetical protein [uncultured Roseovarius sp.]|uniref:hypothetical protein n=1 Tax=uncultured Roseovarius sp. TaxID=293344 RepID=UPI00263053D2|nr:hypothetical protein [uncultured Roseovarius sp.]
MKIKKNTPELLIAGETPWFLAIMLLFFTLTFAAIGLLTLTQHWAGLIFLFVGGGLGVGAMCVFVERLQLILDARAETLTLRSRTMFRYTETVLPLKDVLRAETETGHSNSRNGVNSPQSLSRVTFIIRDGSGTDGTTILPLTSVMSTGKGAATVTHAANEWLKDLRGSETLHDATCPTTA